jgi:hypothetical protein
VEEVASTRLELMSDMAHTPAARADATALVGRRVLAAHRIVDSVQEQWVLVLDDRRCLLLSA